MGTRFFFYSRAYSPPYLYSNKNETGQYEKLPCLVNKIEEESRLLSLLFPPRLKMLSGPEQQGLLRLCGSAGYSLFSLRK